MAARSSTLDGDPLWYKDAVIYQLHVKAFHDSDNDGVGDFQGLIHRLDYLQNLGVTAIWVLPFFPSPLRDDGYDIADYYSVHPRYNTLREFKTFLREAHNRGLRVIIELVINHTSDQHPWFQRARASRPGSIHRDFYVWSDTPEKYADARIIFKDFETSNWTWDPLAKAYYWHRFYSHQPDLNFDNPRVRAEVFRILDFWLGMGVDGVRLDAIPYLYEREGTNCENLPETHEFLRSLRKHVDANYSDRMLLAEANQWPEDAVAYFGTGDECHLSFHFPIMPRMFMALQMEDRFPLVDILDQTPPVPESCQWAIFLRNHDELTLEMVTDEERDYMYRVYARDPRARINLGIRRRLAPLLKNNRRRIELMNFLLFSLPGTPVIYYGDEIGMGDNYYLGDRDGVRTPMQWSPDRNAGFSRSNPQRLYLPVVIEPEYHYESVNVENQEANASSLLWWMRRVIAMRRRFKAFGRGTLHMINSDNPKVLSFMRRYEEEKILVVANLSRFSQAVQLDLSRCRGMILEEVFSRNRFPAIRERPYLFTLGPHDFFWFRFREGVERTPAGTGELSLRLRLGQNWWKVLEGRPGEQLRNEILPSWLSRCPWFKGGNRKLRGLEIVDRIPVTGDGRSIVIVLLELTYTEGDAELYLLPLSWLPRGLAGVLLEQTPQARLCSLRVESDEGVLYDALYGAELQEMILDMIVDRRKLKGDRGELTGSHGPGFRSLRGMSGTDQSRSFNTVQGYSSILYGDRFFLKLYRLLEDGPNPDIELMSFLTGAKCNQVAPCLGRIEYRRPGEQSVGVALLQGFAPNQGSAWTFTRHHVQEYAERLLIFRARMAERRGRVALLKLPESLPSLIEASHGALDEALESLSDPFHLEMTALLGQRTAELHQTLASNTTDPDWRPEPFSTLYQRSVYQSMRSLTRRTLIQLSHELDRVPKEERRRVKAVLSREPEILAVMNRVRGGRIPALKIRIHGDFHLGHVLFTGKDFIFTDFEGDLGRTLSERRLKRSPLRDLAGMVRSFHRVAMDTLNHYRDQDPELAKWLEPWFEGWYLHVSGVFLREYRAHLGEVSLIPGDDAVFAMLLQAFLLEKAVSELSYELDTHPGRIGLPLRGLMQLLGA